MAKLAGHSDAASVRFDDGLCDRQTHTGSLNSRSLVSAAIKLVEDQ